MTRTNDQALEAAMRGLWRRWWPTREPLDKNDAAQWRDIAYADAAAVLAELKNEGYEVRKIDG